MNLTSGQIQDVKRAVIKEVKDSEYGSRGVNTYVSLVGIDLDLTYGLSVAPVVESGLTLIATLEYFEAFDLDGDSIEIANKELVKTITIKLW